MKHRVCSDFSPSVCAPTKLRPKLFLNSLVVAACVCGSLSTPAASLILWNRLGSTSEVLNSAVGPNLSFYTGGDEYSVIANPAYVPGMFGNALTIGPGSYSTYDRAHNVVYNNAGMSSEHGTVEVWYKQNFSPVDYQNGIYRLFDGGFGLTSGIGLESTADGLHFNAYFGGTFVDVSSSISALNNSWIHVAGVWDRNGIDGSTDRVRLYVNGVVVASSTSGAWGTTVGTRADIGGANDYNIVNAFNLDNLKVYDFAMTDFSHRFDENWVVPEPTSAALLAVGSLAMLYRLRQRVSQGE
jgi:hypothetical protein